MPTSPGQAGDRTYIRAGAHKITVDPSGWNKPVGFTHGNLTLSITANKREVMVAEYGSSPIDFEVTGQRVNVKWTMIQRQLVVLDIALQGIYPFNYKSATTPGTRGVGRSGIVRAQTYAQPILLHPITGPHSGDTQEDITLQSAFITPTGNVELSDQGDQLFEVEADCIVLPSASDGELLAILGAIA